MTTHTNGLCAHADWPNETHTRQCAQRLAACPQVVNAVVTLHGDLGAGKTTFVRHLLQALGVSGRIKSPTYAVVEPHDAQWPPGTPLAVWHFDFYRFNDPREWEDAGFRDVFASPGLKLVEWPAQAGDLLPVPDLAIHIDSTGEGSRKARLHAHTPLGASWLGAWAAQPEPVCPPAEGCPA
jgi:tRNA threonylcarbamoyladenosine biosynthesis protein TsaE